MAVICCRPSLDKCALYSKNQGFKTSQFQIWGDASVQMTTDNSRSFHCICSYVAFFFFNVFHWSYLCRTFVKKRKENPRCFSVGQLRGTSLSSRWSTTTFCCSWAFWQPFSCLVDWSLRTNRMADVWFLLGVVQRTNLPIKPKTRGEMEQKILVAFATALLDLWKSAGFVPSRLQKYAEWWGLCWNAALNGSVQEL